MDNRWDAGFCARSPLFAPLARNARLMRSGAWPRLTQLQALVEQSGIVSGGGQPLRLMLQPARGGSFEERYEVRLYLRGELLMRTANWHDFLNLMVWLAFPRAKAALNKRHYQAALAQRESGSLNRGPAQDALTLFDEGGMIVTSSEPGLLDDLRGFAWKRLFLEQRDQVGACMDWQVFGHALYEKALSPYVGVTGRGLLMLVEPVFHTLSIAEQTMHLDERVARYLAVPEHLRVTRDLTPVPVLGVPGWWPANEDPAFYDNTSYFRSAASSRLR
jgi:hypothetical protein